MSFAVVLPHSSLFFFFFFLLLLPDVFSDHFFVYPNGANAISPRPDMPTPISSRVPEILSPNTPHPFLSVFSLHTMENALVVQTNTYGHGRTLLRLTKRYFLPFAKFSQYIFQSFFYFSHNTLYRYFGTHTK
jgi:hypothetical protein